MPLTGDRYVLKRQLLRIFGRGFGIYDAQGTLVLQADEAPFAWREKILLRAPYGMGDALGIVAQGFWRTAAKYDVVDLATNLKIGALQRRWLRSTMRDEWTLMDAWDHEIGAVIEDSLGLALVRRLLLGLVPQNYDLLVGGRKVADLRQNFNPLTYHLRIDFLVPPTVFDRRLGFAAAVLLGAVEGRQASTERGVRDLVDLPF